MNLIPVFTRLSMPETLGYPDLLRLWNGSEFVESGPCGTNPNPKRFSDGAPWLKVFAQICIGKYPFRVAKDSIRGMYFIINPVLCGDGSYVGGHVPTNNENNNHGGAHYADGVLCHRGDSAINRGSIACLTIPDPFYTTVMSHYKIGDTGMLYLNDNKNEPIA